MKTFCVYLKIELLRFLREPIALFFTLILPIIMLYVFGSSFGSASNEATDASYYNSLVSIDVAFLISNFTLMGVGNDLSAQKESGVALSKELYPISEGFKLIVESIAYLLILFTSIILITGYAYIAYPDIAFKGSVLLYVLFIIITYYLFVSFVKLVCTLNYSARTLQLILSSIFFVLLFVSGIVIPKEDLPGPLRNSIDFSPTYIVYSNLDDVWNGKLNVVNYVMYSLIYIGLIIIFSLLVKFRRKRQ